MKRNSVSAILVISVFLALGFFAANEINGFLEITYLKKTTPESDTIPYVSVDSSKLQKQFDLRIVGLGGVGIVPDTMHWGDNYELDNRTFEDLILSEDPYIDTAVFRRIETELSAYVSRMKEFNYNGITLGGFLEFINFDAIGSGYDIYPKDDNYRKRHLVLRKYFGKLIDYAHKNGLNVYIGSDMTCYTTPLHTYLTKEQGKIDTESEAFWEVYQEGLKEVFETMPGVDGFMIRIGEGGSIYNREGWDYYSELDVKTPKATQLMLTKFLEIAEEYKKLIIFRSWSVGVGEVGDMHTNSETYKKVLDDINSNNLVVSTKYCSGDFYSWLSLNPTLSQGKHRRIAEFQCRREFEGMNAFPNYLAPLHQKALQRFANENDHFEGFWIWTQNGGPFRAGPLSIYPFHGFNTITDVNVFATAKLAQNPFADLEEITADWIHFYFGDDSLLVTNLTEMLLSSHEIMRKGLYITEFAKYDVRALGLEPPPMLWIFEWDMVGASSAVMGSIYYICKDDLEAAINEGYEAVDGVKHMKELVEQSQNKATKNKDNFDKLIASLHYQENLFTVLADYRSYFLHYYHWINTGNKESLNTWQNVLVKYKINEATHQKLYAGNLDFPSYNFREANVGVKVAEKSLSATWASRLLILFLALSVLVPLLVKNVGVRQKYGLNGLSLFWMTIVSPSSYKQKKIGTRDVWMIVALIITGLVGGIVTFTSFSAPFFSSFMLGLTVLYLIQLSLFFGINKKENKSLILSLLGSSIPILLLLLLISSVRGPMLFWYSFWTSATFRLFFFSMFILSLLWPYYVLFITSFHTLKNSALKTIGIVFSIQGVQFIVGALITKIVGFEQILTVFNDELLILPGGLSRIMGITTHLNIPLEIPDWILNTGLSLGIFGLMLLFLGRNKTIK